MHMPLDPFELNRATYDQIASRFAEVNAEMPDDLKKAASQLLVCIKGSTGLILDVGCGTGRDLTWFSTQGVRVVGVDLSFGMLLHARIISPAHLLQMDMRALGFDENTFNGIWCAASLLHIPKRYVPSVLWEMARVLVPGGVLYLSIKKGSGEMIERESYTGTRERFFNLFEMEELERLLREAGFQVIGTHERKAMYTWMWVFATKGN